MSPLLAAVQLAYASVTDGAAGALFSHTASGAFQEIQDGVKNGRHF